MRAGDDPKDYLIDHSVMFYLIDPKGVVCLCLCLCSWIVRVRVCLWSVCVYLFVECAWMCVFAHAHTHTHICNIPVHPIPAHKSGGVFLIYTVPDCVCMFVCVCLCLSV